MSSAATAAPANSPTETSTKATNEERARDPKDTGPIDAEVTEEAKRPSAPKAPPRVAKLGDVKKLNPEETFGGSVNEASNARAPRGEANGTPPGPKKGRKGKVATAASPEVTEKHHETAAGMLVMLDMFTRGWAASRYEDVLEPESLKQLDARLKLTDAQIEGLSEPLARGLAENGVELPWWAQLALASAGVYAPKLGTLGAIEKMKKKHDAAQEAAEKAKA